MASAAWTFPHKENARYEHISGLAKGQPEAPCLRVYACRERVVSAARKTSGGLAARFVSPGVVEVEPLTGEWWHVAIGRKVTVKRFNLTRTEAAELVRVLTEQVLTLDRPAS